jgi:hypothetical protein
MGHRRSGFKPSRAPPMESVRKPGARAVASYAKKKELMTALMLSFLLLFTIVAAFVFGIALGYWAICGVLHLFHPARTQRSAASAPALAPTSGD